MQNSPDISGDKHKKHGYDKPRFLRGPSLFQEYSTFGLNDISDTRGPLFDELKNPFGETENGFWFDSEETLRKTVNDNDDQTYLKQSGHTADGSQKEQVTQPFNFRDDNTERKHVFSEDSRGRQQNVTERKVVFEGTSTVDNERNGDTSFNGVSDATTRKVIYDQEETEPKQIVCEYVDETTHAKQTFSMRTNDNPFSLEEFKGLNVSSKSDMTSQYMSTGSFAVEINSHVSNLPEGKRYHAFFWYCQSDRLWVEAVTRRLQNPEYDLKFIFFNGGDFHSRSQILENINFYMNISMRTVLVVSPDFFDSEWGRYQAELGVQMRGEPRQHLLVMIRKCSIPDNLQTLTKIDATLPDNAWWQKLLNTITYEEELIVPGAYEYSLFQTSSPMANLDFLCDVVSKKTFPRGEQIKTPDVPEALLKRGVQLPGIEFYNSMDEIRGSTCFRQCQVFDCFVCNLLCFLCLAGLTIFFIQFTTNLAREQHYDLGLILFVDIFLPVLLVCFMVTIPVQRVLRKRNLRRTMRKVNEILIYHNVIAGLTIKATLTSWFKIKISFWFYDVGPCRDELAIKLGTNPSQILPTECPGPTQSPLTAALPASEEVDLPSRAEHNKEVSLNLLLDHSEEYTRKYLEGDLPRCEGPERHVAKVYCLCQFVENKLAACKTKT